MRPLKLFCWIILFSLLRISDVWSKDNGYFLKIIVEQQIKKYRLPDIQSFSTQIKREEYLSQLLKDFHTDMYLEASVDSIWGQDNDTLYARLHIGKKYTVNASLPDLEVKSKRKSQQEELDAINKTISTLDKQLIYLQENGHPFAEITWDSLQVEATHFTMQAHLDKGPLITYDSIKNRENGKISESFLKSYLGIKKNSPYKESLLKESDDLLKKLPFVKFVKPSTIFFNSHQATMNVYLAQRKVSKFDFIIGLLPSNENGNNKILITGEARLQLQNAFKRGEEIFFEWKRVKANSQKLNLKFNYPYILQSSIGASGTFMLDKRDSSYLDLNWTLGVPYRIKGNNFVKGYIENSQTIVLHVDTLLLKRNHKLPNIQDVNGLFYGLEGYFENLDYLFNPQRGIESSINFQIGTRKIKPNNTILNMGEDYSRLYDSIALKTMQMQFKAQLSAYIPIAKRQVIKLGFQGASKMSTGLLENELYRIGGAKILRGFDEESIYAQHFAIATLEYRFILEQNSYFYTFFDAAWVSRKLEEKFNNNFPFGMGAGIAFETKAGIFGVSYAVGRQQSNPIDFRSSKIHFGYVNIF
ncbi:MAG: BamA/TamA family outer membrane protein [Chitinophagales bacterium]|nr:BamA/TamA family outer membrane protein [Chitinophagales bacterium]